MRWVIIVGLAQAAYILAIVWELNFGTTDAGAVHIDFVAVWAAARLAISGRAKDAFDDQLLVAAQSLGPDAVWEPYVWLYPPTLHMLITPLGVLPFTLALALFSIFSLIAYSQAVKLWSGDRFALAVASPPVVFVLLTGNISLLWAAGLLAGFFWIGRPILAGALIALLSMKPQLGLLIPVVLVFGRQWSVLVWSTAWTMGIVGLSVIFFGITYWMEFFAKIAHISDLYALHGQNAVTMITWYAFARQVGLGHEGAIWVQLAFTLLVIVAVAVVWGRDDDNAKKWGYFASRSHWQHHTPFSMN